MLAKEMLGFLLLTMSALGCSEVHARGNDVGVREDARVLRADAPSLDAWAMPALDSGPPIDANAPIDPGPTCANGTGNVFVFRGDRDEPLSQGRTWTGDATDTWHERSRGDDWLTFEVLDDARAWQWSFSFRSATDGVVLARGTYGRAQRAATRDPGRPGFDLYGRRMCEGLISATFVIHEVARVDGRLSFRASFTGTCGAMFTGCIRYTTP